MDNTLPKHDCRKVLEQLFLVLDGELNEQETHLFLQDMERCSHCLEHYQIEKEFKAFIAARTSRKPCSETLKVNIREQIARLNPDA